MSSREVVLDGPCKPGFILTGFSAVKGHKSSKTTEIYTHVTTKSIEKTISPFENLKL